MRNRSVELNKWFNSKAEPIQCGVELELILYDSVNKEELDNNSLVERILDNLPKQIYRDYYPHQLELRTKPSSNPSDIIAETKSLYNEAFKKFAKHKIYIIPVPSIVRDPQAYCGLHMHVSYPKMKSKSGYYNKAMGMYPFVLALADHCKNFEVSQMQVSDRINKSRHISTAILDKDDFFSNPGDNRKYRDIIFSPAIERDNDRHRMKKPNTIEVRMIDTPSLFSFYEYIVHFIFNLASKVRTDNPLVSDIEKNPSETINNITMTRTLMTNQRYGVNKIFRMLNSDICEEVSEFFGIEFPRETQFEYREKLGISADINGFLSMATKGKWLD